MSTNLFVFALADMISHQGPRWRHHLRRQGPRRRQSQSIVSSRCHRFGFTSKAGCSDAESDEGCRSSMSSRKGAEDVASARETVKLGERFWLVRLLAVRLLQATIPISTAFPVFRTSFKLLHRTVSRSTESQVKCLRLCVRLKAKIERFLPCRHSSPCTFPRAV